MKKIIGTKEKGIGKVLYISPFLVFIILLKLRNSEAVGPFFELLPILGRTLPYFFLTVIITTIFIYKGGALREIRLCWPKDKKGKFKKCISIFLWAMVILAIRIAIEVALQPILQSFPVLYSTSQMYLLEGNFGLLATLLPIMWAMVIAEEVLIRGFFINYLVNVFGGTRIAWLLAIIISSVVFGLFHSAKGPAAMISSGFAGLAFGFGYYLRKNLWPVIVAHCAGNSLGFLGAYFGDDD